MKKFWKKTEGFTLVELIVVIAILGILAGVGTVGYSGYVKKANIAADQQLVAVINQAFSAAYIENGVRVEDITNAEVDFIDTDSDTVNDTVTGLKTVTVNGDMATMAVRSTMGVKAQQIVDSFATYYAGNEGGKFKIYDTMAYDAVAGKFIGYTSADGLASIAGGYRKDYTSASADYMADGTSYKGNEATLIPTVQTFAGAFSEFLADGRADKLMEDPAFAKFCEDNNIPADNAEAVSTGMVMYAAQELSDLNPTVMYSALKSGYSSESGYNLLKMSEMMHGADGSAADLALDGAVLAAAIAGYANSEYGKNNEAVQNAYAGYSEVTNVRTLSDFINNVIDAGKDDEGNDSFAEYLNSQAAADMQAFTGGLGAVHHGTDDLLAAYGDDATFNTLLVQVLRGDWTPSEG